MGELRQFEQPPDYGDGDDGDEHDDSCERCGENAFSKERWMGVTLLVCRECCKPQEYSTWLEAGDE